MKFNTTITLSLYRNKAPDRNISRVHKCAPMLLYHDIEFLEDLQSRHLDKLLVEVYKMFQLPSINPLRIKYANKFSANLLRDATQYHIP